MPPKKFKAFHSSSDTEDVVPPGLTAFLKALRRLPELQSMIFGRLHPQDLFHFFHACPAFRPLLRSDAEEALWRLARQNAEDVPNRPPFLSERAFARLLYSPHCHHCGSAVRKVNWAWYTRVCKRCLPQESYGEEDVRGRMRKWSKFLALGDPLERLFDVYYPKPPSGDRDNDDDHDSGRFYKRQVDGFLEGLPSPETAFSDEIVAEVRQAVKVHAADIWERSMYRRDLQQWSRDWLQPNRDAAMKERREERFTEIVERLRKTSWRGEVDYLDRLGTLSTSLRLADISVRRSIKLSEQEWSKVQVALKPFLSSERQKRVSLYRASFANLGAAIASHCVQLPRNASTDCRPLFIDLAMNNVFRVLIENPGTAVVSAAAFSPFVPSLVAEWHAERRQELTELFSRHLRPIPDGVDPLTLATAVVGCHRCHGPGRDGVKVLRYPGILAHDCPRSAETHPSAVPSRDEDLYANVAMRLCPYTLRASKWLWEPFSPLGFFSRWHLYRTPETTDLMYDIVAALGLDPSRATREEIQRCTARVGCVDCKSESMNMSRWVFTAEAALQHALICAPNSSLCGELLHRTWERAGDEDTAAARAQESSPE